MSRNRERRDRRHRNRTFPGPHDGESSYNRPSYQLGARAANMLALVRANQAEERRAANQARPIPASGPGRRRAKALRNRAAVLERWPELRPRLTGTANEAYSGTGNQRLGVVHHEPVPMGTVVAPPTFEPLEA